MQLSTVYVIDRTTEKVTVSSNPTEDLKVNFSSKLCANAMAGITYLYQYEENTATIKSIKAEVYVTKILPNTDAKQSVSVSYFKVDANEF